MREEIKEWIKLKEDEDFIEISGKELYKILDKYNNQPDYVKVQNGKECYCTERYLDEQYKSAWEELYSEKEMPCSIEYMQNIEEKYHLGE